MGLLSSFNAAATCSETLVKVYLDDVRPTPAGWVRAYTPEEIIDLIRTGKVEAISLDFDLGSRGALDARPDPDVLCCCRAARFF